MTTTLVDLARANYPRQHLCSGCSVVVRLVSDRWTDGGGSGWCWQGVTQHAGVPLQRPAPVISPSPLLLLRRSI